MKNLQVNRVIRTNEGDFELTVYASPSKIGSVGVSVIINRFNGEKIEYLYSTEKDDYDNNKYIDAIKEAITAFNQDKALLKLFEWDSIINK